MVSSGFSCSDKPQFKQSVILHCFSSHCQMIKALVIFERLIYHNFLVFYSNLERFVQMVGHFHDDDIMFPDQGFSQQFCSIHV